MSEPKEVSLEVVSSSALEAITRGEIDVQVSTAKKYPRSITLFKETALSMATYDMETAESCIYVRPVGKEKDEKTGRWEQKFAEGLSIRAAEIVAASYGNIRVGAMIIEQTPRKVVCRGYAHDLQSNYAAQAEAVEVTVKANGEPYTERQAAVVAKACLSKAFRDAIFRVVPKAMFKSVENECRKMIAGDGKSFEHRRAAVVQWVQRLGIDPARVWSALKIEGQDDLTPDHLLTLTGLRTAIKDNETTVDDAFPAPVATGKVGEAEKKPDGGLFTGNKAEPEKKPPEATPRPTPSPTPAPEKPTPEVAKPKRTATKGPSADSLRTDLLTDAKKSSIGKAVLIDHLAEKGWITVADGSNATVAFEALEAPELAKILEGFEEIKDAILHPGAEQ